jgi:hypothetical protein
MPTHARPEADQVDRISVRVCVSETEVGWEVREERNSQVVTCVLYRDWHRVERALHALELAGRAVVQS